jgi:hypothetical protein
MKKAISIFLAVLLTAALGLSVFAANLIPNGDFENNEMHWHPVGCTPLITADQAHTGNQSMMAAMREAWFFAPQITLTIEGGKLYDVSAWVRPAGSAAMTFALWMAIPQDGAADDALVTGQMVDYMPISEQFHAPAGQWTEVKVSGWEAPRGKVSNFYVNATEADGTAAFFIDDVVFMLAAGAPAPEPPPAQPEDPPAQPDAPPAGPKDPGSPATGASAFLLLLSVGAFLASGASLGVLSFKKRNK